MRLHLLGVPSVMSEGRPVAGAAAQPRRLAVLALLARAGARGMTRDKLIATLWSESDDEKGRRALTHALYALRRDLGADQAIEGQDTLRLGEQPLTSDVAEFGTARREGRLTDAAAVYDGPFMDGFHLPEAPEFERWLDDERGELAHDYAGVLEALAQQAADAGDFQDAARWWRLRAAEDPLNARCAVKLMEALDGCGDRAGALRQAQIFEAMVDQELGLAADREVTELAARLRGAPVPKSAGRIAIGHITDYRDGGPAIIAAIIDLLATSLARAGLTVVAPARVHELLLAAGVEPTAAVVLAAARQAGASQLIEGSLYQLPDRRLRLDLRRVDISSGALLAAHRIEAGDPFALADTGAARLAAELAAGAARGN